MVEASSKEMSVDIDVASPLGFVIGVTEAWGRSVVDDLTTSFVEYLGSTFRLHRFHAKSFATAVG